MMFDAEIIKRELRESIGNDEEIDLDQVVASFTMLEGFYCFRINDDAHIFNNNEFIDSFPGYFAKRED